MLLIRNQSNGRRALASTIFLRILQRVASYLRVYNSAYGFMAYSQKLPLLLLRAETAVTEICFELSTKLMSSCYIFYPSGVMVMRYLMVLCLFFSRKVSG